MPVIRKIYRQGTSYIVTIPEWMLEQIGVLPVGNIRYRLTLEVTKGNKIQIGRYAYPEDIKGSKTG